MTNKMVLIGIAIAAVGLIALPQTLALFAGQHNWYIVSPTPASPAAWLTIPSLSSWDTGVPCQKCHADVYAEKLLSGPHKNTVTCESCHIVALALNGSTVGGDKQIHAAGLPSCLDCHSAPLNANWSSAPDATGIFNSTEAHNPFAKQARNSSLLIDANEACVACHTHVAVDINWQKAYKIGFNAIQTASTGQHTWSIGNFNAEGTVNVDTYGNRSGDRNNFTVNNIDVTGLTIPGGFDEFNP